MQVQTISIHASNDQMVKADLPPASADLEQLQGLYSFSPTASV